MANFNAKCVIGLALFPLLGVTLAQDNPCANPQSGDCPKYPNPSCKVVANNEYRFDLQRPGLDKEVGPAIQLHFATHNALYPTYKLPITFLWDSLGLAKLMNDPVPSLSCCGKDLTFTRVLDRPQLAAFAWVGPQETISSTANPMFQGYRLTITLNRAIEGQANVGAGFTEFWFSKNKGPHMTIQSNSGQTVFDADIDCFNASTSSVAVRAVPRSPDFLSGTAANPNLAIHP